MNERNVNHRDASSGERAPKLLESADRVFENVAPRFMLGVPPTLGDHSAKRLRITAG